MTRRDYIRAKMFLAAMQLLPPLVRNELIADRALNSKFGIDVDAIMALGNTGVEFQRSELATVIKTATKTPGAVFEIEDKSGVAWVLTVSPDKDRPGISIKQGDTVLQIGDMALLGEDAELRLKMLEMEAERTNLPKNAFDKWLMTIKERPLDVEELDDFAKDIGRTVGSVARAISERLGMGGISTDALVPRSLDYYERLIGKVDAQPTIREYSDEVVKKFVSDLFAWRRIDGIKHALLLGGHSLIVIAIASLPITAPELKELLEWAERYGDVVARGALIEIALQRPEFKDDISEPLAHLISTFAGQKTEVHEQFALFSAIFVMVYGELAQIGLMASKPVYWQRLAATAQAALIARCILSARSKLESLVDWMRGIRSQQYVLHCYVDLRTDPMWLAEFGLPGQLKNEFAGRVLSVALSLPGHVEVLGVAEVLLGDGPSSLKSQIEPLLASLSGPLEGNIPSVREMQPDDLTRMREELIVAAPIVQSFSVVVSAVLLAKIPPEFAALAAEAIQRAQYKLDAPGEPNTLAACLVGLATFAAITKNTELADALFIVVRNYRRNFADELTADEAVRIGIIACASRSEFSDWCKAIGAFINDFSFGQLTREDAVSLHPLIIDFCNIVPELWAASGEGLAAIEAVGT